MTRLVPAVLVVCLMATIAHAQTDSPLRDSIARAATELAVQNTQSQGSGKMPTKYKVWSSVLIGLGAYYFLSAAVVDVTEDTCIIECVSNATLRTGWLIMGSAMTAGGVAVLAKGIQKKHQSSPSVAFGPSGFVVRETIRLPIGR